MPTKSEGGRESASARLVRRLRTAQGWTQRQLAETAGVSQSRVSLYETGTIVPSRKSLERLAAATGEPVGRLLQELALPSALAAFDEPEEPLAEAGDRSQLAKEMISRAVLAAARAEISNGVEALGLHGGSLADGPSPEDDIAAAEKAWTRLELLTLSQQMVLVDGAGEYQTPALCARICKASRQEAPRQAERAIERARLALHLASRLAEAERRTAERHAWAHLGNARRVANDYHGADQAFANVRALRKSGGTSGLFGEARPLDLEASLRRDQRRFREALDLHDRALALARPDQQTHLLLNRSSTLEEAGSYEQALAALTEAERRMTTGHEPRLLCVLRFNRAVNLCHLERYGEAAALVPEVRAMAAELDNALDLIRTRWLEGRIHLALGRRQEAAAAFEQVRRDFAEQELPYDMALAALDLAALDLEEGRTAEVKALAEEMLAVFVAQNVHREALAAVQLFARAAAAERASAELARRLARYIEQARHDPALRFGA